MPFDPILLGTAPQTGPRDSPNAGGVKINNMFEEIFDTLDAAPFGAYFRITEEDYADPATAIYWGGNWSDDNRWQITKTVAGVQTRATILNNGAVANLAAAWAARASLTYG